MSDEDLFEEQYRGEWSAPYREMKDWIDGASYEELLRRWRYAEAGDPVFQGEMGKYYEKVMARKRKEVGDTEHVKASKRIGWRKT